MSERFWLNDPSFLFNEDNWLKVLPDSTQTNEQRLNSVTRFIIFAYLIASVISMSFGKNLGLFLVSIAFVVGVYSFGIEKLENTGGIEKIDNIKITDENIRSGKVTEDIYKDAFDIFNSDRNNRMDITFPEYGDFEDTFRKELTKDVLNCKTKSEDCYVQEELRRF